VRERTPERTCGSKRQYKTRADAHRAMLAFLASDPSANFSCYRCDFCGWYHFGHAFSKRNFDRIVGKIPEDKK